MATTSSDRSRDATAATNASTAATHTTKIQKRLNIDGDVTYADDGSTITHADFTLTKTDNGNGTATVSES